MFNPFKKSPHYEIGETRDFSCPGMTEFTFKYPVFKGWKMSLEWLASDSTQCALFFPNYYIDHPAEEKKNKIADDRGLPYIKLSIIPAIINPAPGDHVPKAYRSETKNPAGIYYGEIIEAENGKRFDNGVWFAFNNYSVVRIEFFGISLKDDFPLDQFLKTVIESFEIAAKDIANTQTLKAQKINDEIFIHKIVGLGDEVPDMRTYEQACQIPQEYFDKRYAGILKFESLPSNYTEKINDPIYRYSSYMGGQYSCFFKGVYLKDSPDLNILDNKKLKMYETSYTEFSNISFEYPDIEGFEVKQHYNVEKKSGEIIYFSQKNIISTSTPNAHRHPMLIIQKMDSKTPYYSVDKKQHNPNGIEYRIWDEHDANNIEYYFNDPYYNLDTTIEFDVSDTEVYLVSTVNFIYNGIPEKPILERIANSFQI